MDKLKPCPFCGGEGKTEFLDVDKSTEKIHSAFCDDDNCVGSNCMWADFPTKEKAIAAWNTRADDQRTVKLLEALEAEIVARRNSIRVWSLNEFLPVLEAIVEEYKQAEKESPN